MIKRVDISTTAPLVFLPIAIGGEIVNQELDVNTIKLCLEAGAHVKEILPNGDRLALDFTNYNKENGSNDVAKAEAERQAAEEAARLAKEEAERVEAERREEEAAAATEDVEEEPTAEEVEAPKAEEPVKQSGKNNKK